MEEGEEGEGGERETCAGGYFKKEKGDLSEVVLDQHSSGFWHH